MRIAGDKVLGHMGDVLAEKIHGKWETKDPAVLAFILKVELDAAEAAEEELVRARDENGHFIPDDPATPENEAWVKKVVKKATRKKKTAE